MIHYLLAFALTQAIEVPIYMRRALPKRFWAAFGASLVTHPFVGFVLPFTWDLFLPSIPPYVPGETPVTFSFVLLSCVRIALFEAFAIAIEALYLAMLRVKRPLYWSLVANLTSASIGLVLTYTTGWP